MPRRKRRGASAAPTERTEAIMIRCSPAESRKLDRLAHARGLGRCAYLRALINMLAEGYTLTPPPTVTDAR